MILRPETPRDHDAVGEVHRLAFGRPHEARLVELIRASEHHVPGLSIVAEEEGKVVGHILFSYVWLEGAERAHVLSLAPMAVLPGRQRTGIGSALVRAALEEADARGAPLVVVLGHPSYYPRFGFEPALSYGIEPPWPGMEAAFMVKPLSAYDAGCRGRVVYPPAFEAVS